MACLSNVALLLLLMSGLHYRRQQLIMDIGDLGARRPRQKQPRLAPVPLTSRRADEVLENFRFTLEELDLLAGFYQLPPKIRDPETGCVAPARLAVAVVLYRLAQPGPWRSSVTFFGRSKPWLKTMFYLTLDLMYNQCRDRLAHPSPSFLNPGRLATYAAAIRAKGCTWDGVVGFIDGTVYQICRPGGHQLWQRAVYSGHKKCHGLKFQGVNTPDGIIQFMQGPYSARNHDQYMLAESGLLAALEDVFPAPPDMGLATHYSLYGDPGMFFITCTIYLLNCYYELPRPLRFMHASVWWRAFVP